MVKLFFAGDFCSFPPASGISVDNVLKSMITGSDFAVVNFEVPLLPTDVSLPWQHVRRFYQSDDVPQFLKGLGFNLFQQANNHAFDWANEGFLKTKQALGDAAFGAGPYDEAYQVKIVECNGLKIGFMALCYAAYTGVFKDPLNHDGLGCAYINDLRVNHDIIDARKKVDFLFVLPHDGIEYVDIPMPEVIARYRDFIDYGADAVIGGHPHCPQGWEVYKGKPIFYSLGNFLFNSMEGYDFRAKRPHWYEGLCVSMTIDDDKRMSYEVVNTRNVDNRAIVIDNDSVRQEYNATNCQYLTDKSAYEKCLRKICDTLGMEQELFILDRVFHRRSFKPAIKRFINLLKLRKTKSHIDDRDMLYLLINDARRSVLERTLRRIIV